MKKVIPKALIVGFFITLVTMAFEYQTTVTENNDCVGLCASYVSSESEAIARGYPIPIMSIANPGASYEETRTNVLGAFIDWTMYSLIALISILSFRRFGKRYS